MPNYQVIARRKAKKYGLNPDYFVRQIGAESNFDPNAVSPAGARGIAQIMPDTARAWGVDPMRPRKALDAAARNMAEYVERYGGYENALRAYNAGPGNIERSRNFAETNNYVNKILGGKDQTSLNPTSLPTSQPTPREISSNEVNPIGSLTSTFQRMNEATGQTDFLSGFYKSSPMLSSLQAQTQEVQSRTNEMMQELFGGRDINSTRRDGPPIESGGGQDITPVGSELVRQAIKRANILDRRQLPYLWGGGHQGKVSDVRKSGPLDCSGAVSAVLGIDPRVSGEFVKMGKPGRYKGKTGINIYANAEHVLMEINGRFFGTSKSNPGGGAGWIDRSQVSKEYLSRFTVRHL